MTSLHSSSALDLRANWQARLRHLNSSLSEKPEHPFAWRWRIQIKVLTFLLSRYGANASWSQEQTDPIAPTLFFRHGSAVYEHHPLRSRLEIREMLEHIAEINTFKER